MTGREELISLWSKKMKDEDVWEDAIQEPSEEVYHLNIDTPEDHQSLGDWEYIYSMKMTHGLGRE